jgi:WW domain-containing oxidoreductase
MTNIHAFGSRTSADEVLAGIDLAGKNIVITGANIGIGFEAARSLAAAGARVVFACRSVEKGDNAVANAKLAHPDCLAEFVQLDLASFQSIKDFSKQLSLATIDVLICNAGLFSRQYAETSDGIEMTVGVCHFGHFLLTHLLMDRLLAANKPRVVMVSSESHRTPKTLNFDKFPLHQNQFSSFTAYGQAKLANILFANELQRRFADQGLTACSLHPGTFVTTNIAGDSFLMKLISPFTKNPNQGAATTVFCAINAKQEDIAGQYYSHCKKERSTKEANNLDIASKLWALSEKICL